ncbi:hypothetical protein C5167_014802 [Papaver somniferum]|uniref:Uncharacterized protein n=1 Tax=Papaver somniferum TaxID=3469 RepID=A0A4Y7J860_PAPSO|nr:hypothetical protein C5167_014802 [Papaver somniferum]
MDGWIEEESDKYDSNFDFLILFVWKWDDDSDGMVEFQSRKSTHKSNVWSSSQSFTGKISTSRGHNKATEVPVLIFSPANHQLQKDRSEFLVFIPTKSPAKEDKSASPQKNSHNTTSFHRYSSGKKGDKLDCRKKATETEFSLLDLLGEDWSNGKTEGSPVHECHVAFSVDGTAFSPPKNHEKVVPVCLGKTRMETPVHSPQQQCRFPSPPKGAKRHLPSNKYKMNEIKQNAVLYDIDVPSSHTTFDLPFNLRDIRDDHGNTRSDNLLGETVASPCTILILNWIACSQKDVSTTIWKIRAKAHGMLILFGLSARSGIQDDDSTDEKMLDASTTSHLFETDYRSDDLSRENTYNMHAFAFEDPYLQKRENINGMHAFSFEDPYLQKRENSYNMHAFAFEDPYLQEMLPIKNMSLFPFTRLIFFVSISELLFC